MKFKPRVRSKNHSCDELRRGGLGYYPFRSVVRLGSVTSNSRIFKNPNSIIEINTVDAVNISRNKLLMKEAFARAEVPQAEWFVYFGYCGTRDDDPDKKHRFYFNPEDTIPIEEMSYPLIVKRVHGFKGIGMSMINTREELETWLDAHPNTEGWYFERYHNFNREYRLHVTKEGCFYGLRKMLKGDAENRWYRNDSNCVWITEHKVLFDEEHNIIGYDESEDNPAFDKPVNWENIEKDCVKALEAVGLDIGAFDIRIQSSLDKGGNKHENPQYILIEVNSAPSMGTITVLKYKETIQKLLEQKYEDIS